MAGDIQSPHSGARMSRKISRMSRWRYTVRIRKAERSINKQKAYQVTTANHKILGIYSGATRVSLNNHFMYFPLLRPKESTKGKGACEKPKNPRPQPCFRECVNSRAYAFAVARSNSTHSWSENRSASGGLFNGLRILTFAVNTMYL